MIDVEELAMRLAHDLIRQLFANLELTGDDDCEVNEEKPWLCGQGSDRQTQDNVDFPAQ